MKTHAYTDCIHPRPPLGKGIKNHKYKIGNKSEYLTTGQENSDKCLESCRLRSLSSENFLGKLPELLT